jgi:hypothetical protein
MLRGIFMTPGVTPDQVNFYLDLFKKVRACPNGRTSWPRAPSTRPR